MCSSPPASQEDLEDSPEEAGHREARADTGLTGMDGPLPMDAGLKALSDESKGVIMDARLKGISESAPPKDVFEAELSDYDELEDVAEDELMEQRGPLQDGENQPFQEHYAQSASQLAGHMASWAARASSSLPVEEQVRVMDWLMAPRSPHLEPVLDKDVPLLVIPDSPTDSPQEQLQEAAQKTCQKIQFAVGYDEGKWDRTCVFFAQVGAFARVLLDVSVCRARARVCVCVCVCSYACMYACVRVSFVCLFVGLVGWFLCLFVGWLVGLFVWLRVCLLACLFAWLTD